MKSNENNSINFEEVLKQEASNIGIELNNEQITKFKIYKELLLEWNKKMNLTAITDDYQIILKHFIDCLEVVKYIKKGKKIIDVGTGAGFPGLVIAIFFENKVEITLMDSLNKRVVFLEQVVEELDLNNVKLIHARAEELAHKEEYREVYDVAVSRAVAPLNVLLEYDIPYLKVGGKALLLKGNNINEEIKEANSAFSILRCKLSNLYKYTYNVGGEIYSRSIIEIIKECSCDSKYPRPYGKIKKNPLN